MKVKLIVKNFGPITDVSLDLRNVNVFIGPQASGKSTLAKIFTICNSPSLFSELKNGSFYEDYLRSENHYNFKFFKKAGLNKLKKSFIDFSIEEFLKSDTCIEFENELYKLKIKFNEINFEDKYDFEYKPNDDFLLKNINSFYEKYINLAMLNTNLNLDLVENVGVFEIKGRVNTKDEKNWIRFNIAKAYLFDQKSNYIPAERTIVSLIKQSSFAFQKGRVPLPEYLLDFALLYQNSSARIKEFDLSFIKERTKYKNINGEDRIFHTDYESIKLTQSASGFQSIVPLILSFDFKVEAVSFINKEISFIFEECESNLFPEAQYRLLKLIESYRKKEPIKFIQHTKSPFPLEQDYLNHLNIFTTHSPFVLSSFNNMLYAFKKGNKASDKIKNNINKVIQTSSWLDPEEFNAYQIVNGKAKSIMDRKTGLIKDNIIDRVSDEIVNDFRKIGIVSLSNE